GAFADAEIDAAVRDDVERAEALGGARRVVVVRDHLADAMAETNGLGQRCCCGEEDLRRRGVRILVEEVMLDLPGIAVAELGGEHARLQGIVEQLPLLALRPRPRELHLVENAKAHEKPRFRQATITASETFAAEAGMARAKTR